MFNKILCLFFVCFSFALFAFQQPPTAIETSDNKVFCRIDSNYNVTCSPVGEVDAFCVDFMQSTLYDVMTTWRSLRRVNEINGYNADDIDSALSNLNAIDTEDYVESMDNYTAVKHSLENLQSSTVTISNEIETAAYALYETVQDLALYECAPCNANEATCCMSNNFYLAQISDKISDINSNVESMYSSVLDLSYTLNDISTKLQNILSRLGSTSPSVGSTDTFAGMNWHNSLDIYTFAGRAQYNSTSSKTVIGLLNVIQRNLQTTQGSINNYLSYLIKFHTTSISNNVAILKEKSLDHFSFFRDSVTPDSPLVGFSSQSQFDNYYDYLTNHYVRVSLRDYSGSDKVTNWFSRIETLLAALVFNDEKGTNTVDESYGDSQRNQLSASLDGMTDVSGVQVGLMSDMKDNIIDSLRHMNNAFSSAVSMPSTVKLVSVGGESTEGSNNIVFQSSEISQLVEACRCATTLCWCFGGIWLLFLFVSWSVRTSYNLCVFCWSILSSIFGGSGA